MLDFDTAEYRRLSLLAAGVSPSYIPPILDTATWRRLLIAALINNTSTRAISGQVDYYADLPTEIGIPTIGATFLVKYSSGIYLINYKSAGVYIKVADTGSLTDWVYAPLSALATLPDVTLTNPQVGDALVYDGTRWINSGVSSVKIAVSETDKTIGAFGGGKTNVASLSVSANTKYLIEAHFIVFNSSGFAGGPYINILCPLGTTGAGSAPYIDSTSSISNSGTYYYPSSGWLTTPASGFSDGLILGRTNCRGAGSVKGFITTASNPGNIVMQIREYTGSGASGTIYAGSFLKLEKYS